MVYFYFQDLKPGGDEIEFHAAPAFSCSSNSFIQAPSTKRKNSKFVGTLAGTGDVTCLKRLIPLLSRVSRGNSCPRTAAMDGLGQRLAELEAFFLLSEAVVVLEGQSWIGDGLGRRAAVLYGRLHKQGNFCCICCLANTKTFSVNTKIWLVSSISSSLAFCFTGWVLKTKKNRGQNGGGQPVVFA